MDLDQPTKLKEGYHSYAPLFSIVPLAPSAMPSNYDNTQHDGKGRMPMISELLHSRGSG
ncbi:MAG: hypothetical protein JSR62_00290 [Nitrospira sp.]|nr:hypothetical protein [Nitrospira sp.]